MKKYTLVAISEQIGCVEFSEQLPVSKGLAGTLNMLLLNMIGIFIYRHQFYMTDIDSKSIEPFHQL